MVCLVRARGRTRGMALSELSVAALVLLILVIAASPFHRAARARAARLRCQAACRLLAEAQSEYRERSADGGFAPSAEDLRGILPAAPRCPSGGHIRFWVARDPRAIAPGAGQRLVIWCPEHGRPPLGAPTRSSSPGPPH